MISLKEFHNYRKELTGIAEKYKSHSEDNEIISCTCDREICIVSGVQHDTDYGYGIPEMVYAISKSARVYSVISVSQNGSVLSFIPKSDKIVILTSNDGHVPFNACVGTYCTDLTTHKIVSNFFDMLGISNYPITRPINNYSISKFDSISKSNKVIICINVPKSIRDSTKESYNFVNVMAHLLDTLKSLDVSYAYKENLSPKCVVCMRSITPRHFTYSNLLLPMTCTNCKDRMDLVRLAKDIKRNHGTMKDLIDNIRDKTRYKDNRFNISSRCRVCDKMFTRHDTLKICYSCRSDTKVDYPTAILLDKIDLRNIRKFGDVVKEHKKKVTDKSSKLIKGTYIYNTPTEIRPTFTTTEPQMFMDEPNYPEDMDDYFGDET